LHGDSRARTTFITFYRDYTAYAEATQLTKQIPNINIESLESRARLFMIVTLLAVIVCKTNRNKIVNEKEKREGTTLHAPSHAQLQI
jgi:hypothetical protein